jgi:hypothetical protein
VTIADLHATLYHDIGLSPQYNVEHQQRSLLVTKDDPGKVVKELIA